MTRHLTLITQLIVATLLSAALLLTGCANKPVPPDWQANAFSALKGFSAAYLNGNTRLAELEFARAKSEISSTGRADLLARAELIRCAVRVASLEFDNCATYQALAQDAQLQEQAYAVFLSGQWEGLNTALLPVQHREFVIKAAVGIPAGSVNSISILVTLEDPLAQLVAAGVLLQSGRLTPADMVVATQTASNQGWRHPLLAWLGLQGKRANDAGDLDAAVRIQRRIDLVLQTPQKN
jgi:hypothetical protein